MLFYDVLPTGIDFNELPTPYIEERVKGSEKGQEMTYIKKKEHKYLYDGFSARDFQIKEILESGAKDLLQPTSPISQSRLDSFDNTQYAGSSLEASLVESEKVEDSTAASEVKE